MIKKKWVIIGVLWGLLSSLLTLEKHFGCALVEKSSRYIFSISEKIVFFPGFLADKYSCWGWTLGWAIYGLYSILIGVIIVIMIGYGYDKYREFKK